MQKKRNSKKQLTRIENKLNKILNLEKKQINLEKQEVSGIGDLMIKKKSS